MRKHIFSQTIHAKTPFYFDSVSLNALTYAVASEFHYMLFCMNVVLSYEINSVKERIGGVSGLKFTVWTFYD